MNARNRSRGTNGNTNESHRDASQQSSLLHAKRLKRLYAALLRFRRSGRLNPGREAILAAAALELGPDDHLLPPEAGASVTRLQNSVTASKLEAGIASDESLSDTTALTLATGFAWGLKTTRRPGIVTSLLRRGEVDRDLKAMLAFSSRNKLPIIYAVEATAQPRGRRKPWKAPLPIIIVEGSDTVAILRVIQECARRARQGHGPAVIRCTPAKADPLKVLEAYLRERNLWSEQWLQNLQARLRTEERKLKKKRH